MKQKIGKPVRSLLLLLAILIATSVPVLFWATPLMVSAAADRSVSQSYPGPRRTIAYPTLHKSIEIDGLDIFYREAGPQDAPVILLLHGFPTSSHMFRNLIPALSDQFHLIAPDYPGFGRSTMPSAEEFDYTFDNLAEIMGKFIQALGVEQYSLYLMDYGAPIGYRLATAQPERVQALIIQNGNAYAEGLEEFWDPIRALWENPSEATQAPLRDFLTLAGTEWQYTHGTRTPSTLNRPTGWWPNMVWSGLGTRRSSFNSSTTTAPICPSIPNGSNTYAKRNPRPWWFGAKMTRSSRQPAPTPICVTWSRSNFTCSIPVTLPWKRMAMSLQG